MEIENCEHEFESNDFRAMCRKCELPFNHIVSPEKWDKQGKPIITKKHNAKNNN